MMELGARNFAFISRSGADKPEAARVVEQLQQRGASTQVFRADAADEEAVRQVVMNLQTTRPIRGVVHAAMVLKDTIFEQMDHASFKAAVTPKAQGALSLHKALGDIDLDFFVMTSSISAVLGNTGQANYSAANSFLDSLALQRHVEGKVATSLVLPMVLDVGVVAENDSIETALRRKGLYGIDEHEMLHGFEVAMSHNPLATSVNDPAKTLDSISSPLIMGMDVAELARTVEPGGGDAYWYNDARFCHVRAELEHIAASGANGAAGTAAGDEGFASALDSATSEGRAAVIGVVANHIAKKVGNILMLPAEDFELDGSSIASYGLDSMIGAEMRTWLFKEFGLDYPFQKLLAPTLTFVELAAVAAETMGRLPAE
jgi:hypothetical protein